MFDDFIGGVSRTRNPLIASLLSRTGYVEKLGTGITRIRKAISEAGLHEPEFTYNESFIITLFDDTHTEVGDKVGDKVGDNLTENQKTILDMMRSDPRVSASKISEKVGISKRKVEENISKLKAIGRISRVGSAKAGRWVVLDG